MKAPSAIPLRWKIGPNCETKSPVGLSRALPPPLLFRRKAVVDVGMDSVGGRAVPLAAEADAEYAITVGAQAEVAAANGIAERIGSHADLAPRQLPRPAA